jgi:pilus assembly protein Flp/PilA
MAQPPDRLQSEPVQAVERRFRVQRHFWRPEPAGSLGIQRITAAHNRAGWSRQISIDSGEKRVMKNLFNRFVNEDAGQDLIEYALLAGLISLVCVLAIQAAGTKVSTLFNNVKNSIP